MDDLLPLRDVDFRWVADLLYRQFGIHLGDQKRILVAGRLSKRVRQLGLSTFQEYFALLRADSSGNELVELVNRLTTNHSFFFRERDHFDYLSGTVLPAITARAGSQRGYPLRVWSAGCAAGEEPYTLAIVLRECLGQALANMDCGILATDISAAVLREAVGGRYGGARLREMPPELQRRYFRSVGEDMFEVASELRQMVLFKRLNLMSERFPFKGGFDVVFCRNVMIYFDKASRQRLTQAIYDTMKPGGYFFIGHSESLPRDDCPFEYVKPAVYRKSLLGAAP
jgi:chemotaxis protein methyltransferase CheR